MPQRMRPRSICNRIGLGLFVMMIVWYASTTLISFQLLLLGPGVTQNPWVMLALNDLPLYALGVPAFLLITCFVPSAPKVKSPRIRFHAGHYLLAVVFMFGAAYALNFVTQFLMYAIELLAPPGGGTDSGLLGAATSDPLASLVFLVLVPAFGEEFVFRYMLRRKMGECGDRAYIFMSALCFSMFHANLAQLPFTFVLGALFAWLYVSTGWLWVPISLHFLFNTVGGVLAPMISEGESMLAAVIMGVLVLLLIPAAITLFFVFRKRVFSTMRPPAEPGWPYKAPRWLPAWLWKQEVKRRRQALAAWQAANPNAPPPVAPVPAWPPPARASGIPSQVMAQPYRPSQAAAGAGQHPQYPPQAVQGQYLPPGRPVPYPPPAAPYWPAVQPPPAGYVAPARPSTMPYGAAMAPYPPARDPRLKSPLGVCVGNVGTILFLALSGSMVVLNILIAYFI